MMKILLANPPGPWVRCRWDIKIKKDIINYYPYPVRLSYATALLKKNGYDAYLVDATAEEISREEFIERFKKIDPDILVWETIASSFDYDLETIEMLRKIKPKLIITTSGYHASAVYDECLKRGYDFVVVGECDYSILDLVKYVNKEIKQFPKGVAAKGQKFVPRELIQNLDELPWPERESLPMHKYNDPKLNGFNVVMVSSRGCPWGCAYCTSPVYYGKPNYRMRDPKKVVDEMMFLWDKYKPDELYFDDDNFAVNKKHTIDICNEIIGRKIKMRWNCMVDATINEETLRAMKAAGCTGITVGSESLDPAALKHLGKPTTREMIINLVKLCKRLGIRTHMCWVLGLPYSTKKGDEETVKTALSLPSDTLQFSICTPYLGTKMYKWCEENGYLEHVDWKNFCGNDMCMVNYPGYNHKDIEELYKRALVLWHRKMLLRKPAIVLFHLYNAYKYQGPSGVIRVSLRGLKNVIK